MRVTFASGAWVEAREITQLNARDKAFMLQAMTLEIDISSGATRSPSLTLELMTRQHYAVMDRIITSWSYEYPKPGDDPARDDEGKPTYDESLMMMPIDDYNELEEFIQPYVRKLNGGGPKETAATTSRSNGSSKARAASSRKG